MFLKLFYCARLFGSVWCDGSNERYRSMHGEMLRRMAEGDRDRRKEREDIEKAAKVKYSTVFVFIFFYILTLFFSGLFIFFRFLSRVPCTLPPASNFF